MPVARTYIRGIFWKSITVPDKIMRGPNPRLTITYNHRNWKQVHPGLLGNKQPQNKFEFRQDPTDVLAFICNDEDALIMIDKGFEDYEHNIVY